MSCGLNSTCSSRALIPGESRGEYAYQMQINSRLHPDAVCVGEGPGLGVQCSAYGALRRPVGGPNGIGDPTLVQRSWRSSGCQPGALNDMVDTLSDPVSRARVSNGVILNRGAGSMGGYHTRNFQTSVASWGERDISAYTLFPNNWADGYIGVNAVNGWIPTRTTASCNANSKYAATAEQPVSSKSYGSYGMYG
jgi:hypothetical protein